MVDKLWKAVERKVAKLFGSERSPCSGSPGKVTASDTLHKELFIEVKHRAQNAVGTWYKKAREQGRKEGKIPVVVLHIKSTQLWLVVCNISDMSRVAEFLDLEISDDDQWPLH